MRLQIIACIDSRRGHTSKLLIEKLQELERKLNFSVTLIFEYLFLLLCDDSDFVGLRSLRALDKYGIDHYRERLGYKEIRVQVPISSSNKSSWFFNVPGEKHEATSWFQTSSPLVVWESRIV